MTPRPNPPERYRYSGRVPTHGGYGEIEVWHDEMLNRDVAIKWIISTEGEDQLLNEWRVLSSVLSRYVVEIYDLIFDHHGALHGIVMEFISGGDLSSIPPPSTPEECQKVYLILFQLACGLADLHAHDIVHRDVKPENAMIGTDGRLKICDFGLSGPSDTVTYRARATMGYRAPELHEDRSVVTYKSDVYAFGVLAWRILTGALPTVGRFGLPEGSHFPLPSISTVRPDISSRLSKIIDRCLSWRPEDRPGMALIAKAICAEITKGRHAGSISLGAGPAVINISDPRRKIGTGQNSIQVRYDEYEFVVELVVGDVFINNQQAAVGSVLTEGCLLTFGGHALGSGRAFAPFRQFTPEVVI